MTPLNFWLANVGSHLCPAGSTELPSPSMLVDTHQNKGIGPLRIGAIDLYYVASPKHSQVIGRLAIPSTSKLTNISTTTGSAMKAVAHWLVHDATFPMMVGLVGKSDPTSSFEISEAPEFVTFCQAGGSFSFNLVKVRHAVSLSAKHPWKTVWVGLQAYNAMRFEQTEAARKRMKKLVEKDPWLADLVTDIDIQTGSGEFTILSWYNIQKEAARA